MISTPAKEKARFLRWRRTAHVLRYPTLALAHGVAGPVLWGINRSRFATPLVNAVGRRFELTRTKQGSFDGYTPGAHDVLVCSYGKSGTNWMLQIALQIAHLGDADFDHVHSVVPWPDAPAPGYAVPLADMDARDAAPTGLRVIKTHLPWRCVPYAAEARYLCVVRDPKDVIVSGYHFFRSVLLGPLMPPVPVWIEHVLSEESFLGSWTEHLHGYWQQRDRENVLLLTYEEMKADLPGAIDRAARLMGVPLSAEQRARATEKSGFAYMRGIDHKFYPGLVSPLGSPHGKMMRAGQSNTSSALLTREQEDRIDSYYKKALKARGCDFPYDEAFRAV